MHMMMVTPVPDKDGKVMTPIAIGMYAIKRIEDTSFVPETVKVVPPKDAPVVPGKEVKLEAPGNTGVVPPLPMVIQSTIIFVDGEVMKVMEHINTLVSMAV